MKVGLEIHQQLNTKNKLFCSCKCILSDKVEYRIKRKLNIAKSELGEIDIAAQYEKLKNKYFIYEYHPEYSCLVELDEEPPHIVNFDALKISLALAEFFDMYVPNVLQVMRKIVVDGSNTSGFQRTILIALNGKLKIKDKEYKIQTLCLEEDSCRKIEEKEEEIVYRLDRLGIPLIEIATGPDITDPNEAREVAKYMGLILRLTGKVKRGLGTIRQDLNVSIEGGNKIEIKGVQDLDLIKKVVELEVERQKRILQWRDLVKKRGIDCIKLKNEIYDLTKVFEKTNCKIIKKNLEKNGKVLGIKLEKFKGLLSFEIGPNRRIGTELSDIAKLFGLGGIFHSDELPRYGITEEEVKNVKKVMNAKEEDAFIIVSGPENKCKTVLIEIVKRLNDLIKGVPKDTRKANIDGTTSFLRPQPTAMRMYPETDHPLIYLDRIEEDRESYKLVRYKVKVGDLLDEFKFIKLKERNIETLNKIEEDYDFILDLFDPEFRKNILKSYGLSDKIVEDLLWSEKLELFEYLVKRYKVKPTLIYYLIHSVWYELKKKGIEKTEIDIKIYEKILELIEKGKIVKEAIPLILEKYVKTGKDILKIVEENNLFKIEGEKLKEEIYKLLKEIKERDKRKIYKIIFDKLRYRAEPKEIIKYLEEFLSNEQ